MKEKIKELKDFFNVVEIWIYLNEKEYEKYFEEYNKAIKELCETFNKEKTNIKEIINKLEELRKFFPHEKAKIFHPKGHLGSYIEKLENFLRGISNGKSKKEIQDALEELKKVENIKQIFSYFIRELETLFYLFEEKNQEAIKNNKDIIKLDDDLIKKIKDLKEDLEEFHLFIKHLVTIMNNEELKEELIKEIKEKNPGIDEKKAENYVLNLEKQLSFAIKKSENEENDIENLLKKFEEILKIEEQEIKLNKLDEAQTIISNVHKVLEQKLKEFDSFSNDLITLIEFYKNNVVSFVFEEMERIKEILDKKIELSVIKIENDQTKVEKEEKKIGEFLKEVGKQIENLIESFKELEKIKTLPSQI